MLEKKYELFIGLPTMMDVTNSCFEKGCQKKCTRQSWKVRIVGGFEFKVFQRNLKEWHETPCTDANFASTKGKQQK